MEKLLTIVIPAYNMEALLPRCLDSICVENVMDRVQVLVVNDGSKDRTLEIARGYESRYPHYFTVIDKDNGNYGSCMNVGLAQAQGKYFRTLDADDWYDSQAYEQFVDELERTDADMLICERYNYHEINGEYELIKFDKSISLNKDIHVRNDIWLNNGLKNHETVTCLCYKTSILKGCDLKWSEHVFYSDTEYDYFPLHDVETVRFVSLPVYVYLIGRMDQSMSPQNLSKNFHSFFIVANRVVSDFVTNANPSRGTYLLQKKYLLQILHYFYNSILYHGFKFKKEVAEIDNKIKILPDLYRETNDIDTFRKYRYIYAYRYNKKLFWLLHKQYRIYLSFMKIKERV